MQDIIEQLEKSALRPAWVAGKSALTRSTPKASSRPVSALKITDCP